MVTAKGSLWYVIPECGGLCQRAFNSLDWFPSLKEHRSPEGTQHIVGTSGVLPDACVATWMRIGK